MTKGRKSQSQTDSQQPIANHFRCQIGTIKSIMQIRVLIVSSILFQIGTIKRGKLVNYYVSIP